MKLKYWYNIYHVIVIPNSIVQHIFKIKNEIMINVNVSAKSIACARKIIAGILAHVFVGTVGVKKLLVITQ